MTLVIADTDCSAFRLPEDSKVIAAAEECAHCVGCFGCWVKTPGECVIKDDISRHGGDLARCSCLVIVSRCVYGGFSPAVKRVIDRSIPYIHPNFIKKNGEMHHKRRYDNSFAMEVYFYGGTTEAERQTAQKLVRANTDNLWCSSETVSFFDTAEQIGEVQL